MKEKSFADGLKLRDTKGALVIPKNLTKKRAEILWHAVNEFKTQWYMDHDESDKEQEEDMQAAMQWLLNQINKRWSVNELHSP